MTSDDRISIPGRMSEAGAALEWLADGARKLPREADDDLGRMVTVLMLARRYVLGYAAHRAAGRSEAEAIEAAARGELDMTSNGERRGKFRTTEQCRRQRNSELKQHVQEAPRATDRAC